MSELTNCPWCGLDIQGQKNTTKANHVRWCSKNPKADDYRKQALKAFEEYSLTEKYIEDRRKGGIISQKTHPTKLDVAKAMGKLSRFYENRTAAKLDYEEIFLPQEVCDRIAFKNGEIVFIEIKRKNGKLTPKQQRFKELVGEKFIIVYDQ